MTCSTTSLFCSNIIRCRYIIDWWIQCTILMSGGRYYTVYFEVYVVEFTMNLGRSICRGSLEPILVVPFRLPSSLALELQCPLLVWSLFCPFILVRLSGLYRSRSTAEAKHAEVKRWSTRCIGSGGGRCRGRGRLVWTVDRGEVGLKTSDVHDGGQLRGRHLEQKKTALVCAISRDVLRCSGAHPWNPSKSNLEVSYFPIDDRLGFTRNSLRLNVLSDQVDGLAVTDRKDAGQRLDKGE